MGSIQPWIDEGDFLLRVRSVLTWLMCTQSIPVLSGTLSDIGKYGCNVVFPPEESSDLLLAANHGEQSCFLHQQIVRGRACDLAQVPAFPFIVRFLSLDKEKSRLRFSLLLEAKGGVALIHLFQGEVLGAGSGSKIPCV